MDDPRIARLTADEARADELADAAYAAGDRETYEAALVIAGRCAELRAELEAEGGDAWTGL